MDIEIDSLLSPTSSVTGEEYSQFISELVNDRQDFIPGVTKYVCHTSTIPLASVIDHLSPRRKDTTSFVKEWHGPSRNHIGCYNCNQNFCMFVNAKKERTENFLAKNCPCQGLVEDGKLTPICFLTFLKTLNHNLTKSEITIQPTEVMFCLDGETIFANRFSRTTRTNLGVSGFGHICQRHTIPLLRNLYWFRKFSTKYKLEKLIEDALQGPYSSVINSLKQTLHTINNLLIKKFEAFGPEITGYGQLAEQTARLFRDLFSEYMARSIRDILPEATPPVFKECKDFFNYVKQNHDHKSRDKRISILDYKFCNRSLGSFFGTEFRRCKSYIDKRLAETQQDYTASIAWDFRSTILCQTRTLGYLPYHLMREKAHEFWAMVSRPVERPDPNKLNAIKCCVYDELSINDIPVNCLRKKGQYHEIIKDSVKIELKYSASVTKTVSAGGKPEDARNYLAVIRNEKIIIPIRNLDTFEITGYTPLLKGAIDDEGVINLSSILFWLSLQIAINFSAKRGLWRAEDYYDLGPITDEDFLNSELICVNEPGKARMLIKSMSVLNWFLTPAGKISQKILGKCPDHKAGLELGSHDWHHTKRISGESAEARFMYDPGSGRLKKSIIMGYMDWTEATDAMVKRVGIAHLQAFWGYIGFPEDYGKLILTIIREPQPVTETLMFKDIGEEPERLTLKGTINEGFMMGNQMTKTILHLSHFSQRNFVEKYLNSKNIAVKRSPQGLRRRDISRLNRKMESSELSELFRLER